MLIFIHQTEYCWPALVWEYGTSSYILHFISQSGYREDYSLGRVITSHGRPAKYRAPGETEKVTFAFTEYLKPCGRLRLGAYWLAGYSDDQSSSWPLDPVLESVMLCSESKHRRRPEMELAAANGLSLAMHAKFLNTGPGLP